MAQVLVDTSGVYAIIDRHDSYHAKAVAALRTLSRRNLSPLLTNFIIAESHALLLSRLGSAVARNWLVSQIWPIERVQPSDEDRAQEIIRKSVDKTFSYTDAVSFAVMERLAIRDALAFDPHFEQYGFRVVR